MKMKKFLIWMVTLAIWVYGGVLPMPIVYANDCSFSGDGSAGSPFQIATRDQLYCLSQSQSGYLDKHIRLTADIDFTGWDWNSKPWIVIGRYGQPFTGSFDGNGYRIKGLRVVSDLTYTGMFGYVENGTIQNIGLEDVSVSSSQRYTGGLVGRNDGGIIQTSYVIGTVTGTYYVGGLVGENDYYGTVRDSYAIGNVSGTGFYIGGLAGSNFISTIENSYAVGNVTGAQIVGGLVGQNYGQAGIVTNSYAAGSVTGNITIAGLVGNNGYGKVEYSYWSNNREAGVYNDFSSPGTITNVTKLSEEQMKAKSSFNYLDFNNKWTIMEGGSYPYLKHPTG
jgi:hypothetical protein